MYIEFNSKKWRKHDTAVNVPGAGRPPDMSERARRRHMREDTMRPVTTLKEFQAPEAQI